MIRARHAMAASLAATALLASAACSGSSKTNKTSAAPTAPAASSTSAKAPAPAAKNPYTGIGPVPKTPTISVKIDDTPPGRPQRGIDKADIVYIIAVEGGLTRLAAIFGTNKPTVGYVRSTRPSDPELLLQFGKITAAFSGGGGDALPLMRKSGIRRWSNDGHAPYYARVNRSQSTYINLVLNLAKVAKKTRTTRPRSIGWTFAPTLTGVPSVAGRRMRTTVTGSYSSGTPVDFRYWPSLHKYVRYIDGVRQVAADGQPVTATNVIVQQCRVLAHRGDVDVNGNPSQYTYTVGTGKVSVFRQGRRVNGTWRRPNVHAGTTLRTAAGKPLPLAPGNTWVVLIRRGVPVTG